MTDRLKTICGEILPCKVLADVGCDHGYIAKAALDGGKCERVIVSDISAKSLEKAVKLLKDYGEGRFSAIVSDGFENFIEMPEESVIAGMGGEEINGILKKTEVLPDKLILQPMKNTEKVRRFLVANGFEILKDYTFCDVKYYDLIVAKKGKDFYSEDEFEFGRDNLKFKNAAFISLLKREYENTEIRLKNGNLKESSKVKLLERKRKLSEVMK